MADKLNPGEAFPTLSLKIPGGDVVNVPGDMETPLSIVLFYRGHW
jgi:hypothetical protein